MEKKKERGKKKEKKHSAPWLPLRSEKLGDFEVFYSPLLIPPEGLKVIRVGQQFEIHLISLPPHLTIGKLDEMKSVIELNENARLI